MINKNFLNFSAMLGHPKRRGMATPILWQKFKYGGFQNSSNINELMIIKFSEFFSAM